MSQDDVRRDPLLESFEILLDIGALVGKKAVSKTSDENLFPARTFQKKIGAAAGFLLPLAIRTEDDPGDFEIRVFLKPAENGASAADFNIVGVRSQTKKFASRIQLIGKT